MPPRIGPRRPVRLYLTLHREAKKLSLEQLGGRFDPPIAKGTVQRLEKKARDGRISAEALAAYAEALGKNAVELYRPPADPSLDAMVSGLDDEARSRAIGYVEGLTGRKAS